MSEVVDGTDPRTFRILSLDGGGIRGAFAAGYLAEIERVVGHPIGEYFDLISGTSTGGIIAAGLACRVPAAKIEQFYRERGPRIFRRRWWSPSRWVTCLRWLDWGLRPLFRIPIYLLDCALLKWIGLDNAWVFRTKYDHRELMDALTEVFAEKKLGESENRLVIPSINVKKGQTKVFKTRHLPHLYTDANYRFVDIVRGTTAAPTYFEHIPISKGSAYVDGGLWANNPTMVAIVESMAIARDGLRPEVDGKAGFNLDTTYALSIGAGAAKFFADPPKSWAGLLWWNPAKLLSLISLSQSQGAQFQAQILLGPRLKRVEFALPHGDWSLDNTKYIHEMIDAGRERASEDIAQLKVSFFSVKALPFHSFPPMDAPPNNS